MELDTRNFGGIGKLETWKAGLPQSGPNGLSLSEILKNEVLYWLQKNEWKGCDPFDGLTSPWVKPWVSGELSKSTGSKWIRLAFLQVVKRSPWNLRRLLKIQPQENAMSWGVGLLGALEAIKRKEPGATSLTQQCAIRLLEMADSHSGLWGYPFPWQARAFYVGPNDPNLVISAISLWALAEYVLSQKVSEAIDSELSSRIRIHYSKAIEELVKQFYKPDPGYFSYVSHDSVLVHNANLFGSMAVILGIAMDLQHLNQYRSIALAAIGITLQSQEPNGRWSYGTKTHHSWADCFHTAYNLSTLCTLFPYLQSDEIEIRSKAQRAIQMGIEYYLTHAFTSDGSAKYYDNKTWPIETHSFAAALICLKRLSLAGWIEPSRAREMSRKVVLAAQRDTYLGNGAFAYRKWQNRRIKTVFTRWTQSWMYFGLESAVSLGQERIS